jgi:hypothetical protein
MPTPNAGFVQSLKSMDGLLDVRWGPCIGQFVIERKAVIPQTELGYLIKREKRLDAIVHDESHPQAKKKYTDWCSCVEELRSAKTGKRVICITSVLSDGIFNMLCQSDIKRYGGYSRYADELEAAELKMHEDQERIAKNTREAIHKETYDMLRFIWSKKETELLSGERNMNRLLHGKKSNKPLIEPEKKAEPRIQLATH